MRRKNTRQYDADEIKTRLPFRSCFGKCFGRANDVDNLHRFYSSTKKWDRDTEMRVKEWIDECRSYSYARVGQKKDTAKTIQRMYEELECLDPPACRLPHPAKHNNLFTVQREGGTEYKSRSAQLPADKSSTKNADNNTSFRPVVQATLLVLPPGAYPSAWHNHSPRNVVRLGDRPPSPALPRAGPANVWIVPVARSVARK
jgi:hypothetical protein